MNIKSIVPFAVVMLACLFCVFAGCTGTPGSDGTETATPTPTQSVSHTGSAVESVVDANNMFAFEIYKQLSGENSKDDNLFLSPFSISSALALTYEGAKGETADQIKSVFYFPDNIETLRSGYQEVNAGINAGDPEYDLEVANALWAEETYPFLKEYINTAKTYYSANTTNLDFINQPEESRVSINDWVAEKTNDKIEDLIPEGMIDSMTRLVITNAIYFKGTWVLQFDKNMTTEADFTTPSGETVTVEMMKRTDDDAVYGYTETDGLQVLEMPYENESGKKLSMIVLLPKENDLKAAEDALSADNFEEIENSIKSKQVKVYFPKFKLETEYLLRDILIDIGMPAAFSGSANFSGMDGTTNLFISNVVHKAFVEVNEEGTEAAAATAVVMASGMSPEKEPIPVFRADHSFIFMIQDDETGNILFIGRISNPAE
ncbi:proteinase inhibitor I4 serpin [Methanolacinia petrolearia DSM 11571]|uniref:Proteinase inhibitor I4 serpin n=1 Tax=Methanolacinia petrolearia (strain DSM 11571 / OCM 486 / SEBR 4847) TaxID=679926 RepID=E1RK56_METP4|nr:serpin family protein [Methanolacinia petrolearia]ADN35779.1 proteinase inhibitor I4 serpin [Methanolacinia petrolearia DSM 11571]